MSPLFRTFRQVFLLSLTAGLPLSVFATDSRVFVQFTSGKNASMRVKRLSSFFPNRDGQTVCRFVRRMGLLLLAVFAGSLFLEASVRAVDLTPDALEGPLKESALKNSWCMYSTRDGSTHTCQFLKDGSFVECDPTFADTHRFGLGSNTKTLTAVMVIQAVEEGRLSLSSTIEDLARQIEKADEKAGRPNLPIEVHSGFKDITLMNVLTHQSGFPGVDTTDFMSPKEGGRDALMRKILKQGPVGWGQDEKDARYMFAYSNEGYAFLGELLERISEPFEPYDTTAPYPTPTARP